MTFIDLGNICINTNMIVYIMLTKKGSDVYLLRGVDYERIELNEVTTKLLYNHLEE